MHRRDFLSLGAVGAGGLLLPSMFGGRAIAAEELVSTLDIRVKKALADAGMNAAKAAGASYCDVRVGRYLRQFVITREANVQNIVNTESVGVGIRSAGYISEPNRLWNRSIPPRLIVPTVSP